MIRIGEAPARRIVTKGGSADLREDHHELDPSTPNDELEPTARLRPGALAFVELSVKLRAVSRSFVVTGGGQGVGRAIAERLLADGHVVVLDRDLAVLEWVDRQDAE